jgi:putative lipoprotein
MIDGYNNSFTRANNTTVIGTGSKGSYVTSSIVMGDNANVENTKGSVMIGDTNSASYVNSSLIAGAKNSITGTEKTPSASNILSGVGNTASAVQHVSAIGSGNTVNNTATTQILGDTNTVSYAALSSVTGSNNTLTGTADNVSSANILDGSGNTASNVNHVSALGAVNGVTNADKTQVLGDRNRATNTNLSQMFGVNNVLSTTDGAAENAKDIQIGYGNSAINVQNVTSIGSANTVLVSKMSQVIGDNRYLSNVDRSVVIGSADSNATQMTSDDIVAVGYNSYATASGGAAFGSGSVAGTAAGYAGYDPLTNLLSLNTSPAWKSTRGAVSVGDISKGITRQITGVAAGTQDTDAVNVAQLKKVVFARQNATQPNIKAGNGIQVIKTSDGMYTISANITGTTSETGHTSASVGNTAAGNTGTSGANSGGTTILPITPDSNTSVDNGEVVVIRNVTDPTSFKADDGNSASISPKGTLSILGDSTNTETSISGDSLKVSLKKDITVDSVKAGNTTINNDGVTIKGGPSMTSGGINAGGRKVTNVAPGEISASSTDAVNGSQIHELKGSITNNTTHLTQLDNRVGDLDHRVNEVGAGAAALAGLHPVDYDPDSKWNVAVSGGSYKDQQALALGAFYHPNDDTLLSLGTTVGYNDNMVTVGASFKVGERGNVKKVYPGEAAKELTSLKKHVAEQDKKLASQDQRIGQLETMLKEQKEINEKQQQIIAKLAAKVGV